MSDPFRLPLPYPRPPLSLNLRMHWAKQAGWKRQIHGDVLTIARAFHLPTGLDRVRVTLVWAPKVRRRRDTDNPAPTLKAAIDGLVAYGLVPDDDSGHVESGVVILDPGHEPGVWLLIENLSEVSVDA